MLGAWRVAGIWSLGALQLVSAKKSSPCRHAVLLAEACKLHRVTTNRRYLIPQTKSTNKTIFCTYLHSFLPKKNKKGVCFGKYFTPLASPPINPKNHHCAMNRIRQQPGPPDVVPLGTWTFVHLHHHHQSRRSVTSKGHGPSLTRWRWEFFGVWKTFPIEIFSDQANKKAFFGIESWHKS